MYSVAQWQISLFQVCNGCIPFFVKKQYSSFNILFLFTDDIIGPVIRNGILNIKVLLKRESKGAMDTIFEMYTNIWSLHYLRYTNQLKWETLKEMLYEINSLYAESIRYFNKNGWFSHWESDLHSRPSVW